MSRKTLLCVDDEVIGLHARKLVLERHGYHVLTAHDGEAGLSAFEKNQIDAVVLDYQMPGMTGGVVATAMKRTKPEVPIILLSAYLSLPKHEASKVDAFLMKGESPQALLQKIAELTDNVSP